MNYERMSNKKLLQLVHLRIPDAQITGVDGKNRSTVIAFLKFYDASEVTGTPKTLKRTTKAI